jgi:hypothetical protein
LNGFGDYLMSFTVIQPHGMKKIKCLLQLDLSIILSPSHFSDGDGKDEKESK